MRLKIAVLESGRLQRDVANRSNVGEIRFSQIVNGKRPASADEQDAIAKELGVPREAIFRPEAPDDTTPDDSIPSPAVNA